MVFCLATVPGGSERRQTVNEVKPGWRFKLGDHVEKISGSSWYGTVVGFYSTKLTPEGYCVESFRHEGSVQIYPVGALRKLGNYVGEFKE